MIFDFSVTAPGTAPGPRCSHSLTLVGDDDVYLIGGARIDAFVRGFVPYGDVWRWRVRDATWEEVVCQGTELFQPRRGHTAVAIGDTKIVVFGGAGCDTDAPAATSLFQRTTVPINSTVVLDIATATWYQPPTHPGRIIPPPRRGHAATVYNGEMVVVGGDVARDMVDWDGEEAVWVLNLTSWEWRKVVSGGSDIPFGLSLACHERLGPHTWMFFAGTTFEQNEYALSLWTLDLNTWEWMNYTWMIDWEGYSGGPPRGRFSVGGTMLLGCCLVGFGGTVMQDGLTTGQTDDDTKADLIVLDVSCLVDYLSVSYSECVAHRIGQGAMRVGHRHRIVGRKLAAPSIATVAELPWPCARNGAAMVAVSSTRAMLFGGGVYATAYFDDTWILDVTALPTVPWPSRMPTPHDFKGPLCLGEYAGNDFCAMFDYFATLFDADGVPSRRFTDVSFALDCGAVVRAHRLVLAARCTYFRSLFDGAFADGTAANDVVRLHGVDRVAFLALMRYWYCGALPDGFGIPPPADEEGSDGDEWARMVGLLEAANMLGVEAVKSEMEGRLCEVLRLPNDNLDDGGWVAHAEAALAALAVADTYCCVMLTRRCQVILRRLMWLRKWQVRDEVAALFDRIRDVIQS
jgi:hypothetical protein